MSNKIVKLLAVVAGLMLTSSFAFAGSDPAPGPEALDGTPKIKRVRLSIAPSFPDCVDATGAYTGVGCTVGDLTIVGNCAGIIVSAALRSFPLEILGLDAANEDITDISKEGLVDRVLPGLGNVLLQQNPNLETQGCQVTTDGVNGRSYEIRKVTQFRNKGGLISAKIKLVPQD